MSTNAEKTIEAVALTNNLKLSMLFNVTSSDGQALQIRSTNLIPIKDSAKIDEDLCSNFVTALETIYPYTQKFVQFIAGARTFEELQKFEADDEPLTQKPEQKEDALDLLFEHIDELQEFAYGLADDLEEHLAEDAGDGEFTNKVITPKP